MPRSCCGSGAPEQPRESSTPALKGYITPAMRFSLSALALVALVALIGFSLPAAGSKTKPTEKCPQAKSVDQQVEGIGTVAILLTLEKVVRTKGTSCKTAVAVMDAWTKCRMKKDYNGHCTSKVLGYSCTELREGYGDSQSGRVLCRKGKSYVGHTWSQRPGCAPEGCPTAENRRTSTRAL